MKKFDAFIITCEHGGNRVPARFAKSFVGADRDLNSHRGFDPGALELARALAHTLGAPLLYSTVSRLLIELNRSPGHRQLFSKYTRKLDQKERDWIFQNYYVPYRNRVEKGVGELCNGKRSILHLSIHSYTPVLNGERRNADVGLLYDPARSEEKAFCRHWGDTVREEWGGLTVRMNYPYQGKADGMTTYLRKQFPESAYAGVELEVNQRHLAGTPGKWGAFKFSVINSLIQTLNGSES